MPVYTKIEVSRSKLLKVKAQTGHTHTQTDRQRLDALQRRLRAC